MMTDTDSFLYNIKNQDIYKIMDNNKDKFDLSNYPKDHFLYDSTNNKTVNKFKDEKAGLQITNAVCLRSKSYSLICENDIISKNTCKGVKQNVSKKLTINDYNDVRVNRNSKEILQNVICSKKHELYSMTQIKTALSANDDKVYICDDNIHTYNFGYKGEKNY